MDESKTSQSNYISTIVIKENYDIFATFITEDMIKDSVFPDSLKQADIKPVCKKDSRNERENYRPVSILRNMPKICGRCMCTQMGMYFDPVLFVDVGLILGRATGRSNV